MAMKREKSSHLLSHDNFQYDRLLFLICFFSSYIWPLGMVAFREQLDCFCKDGRWLVIKWIKIALDPLYCVHYRQYQIVMMDREESTIEVDNDKRTWEGETWNAQMLQRKVRAIFTLSATNLAALQYVYWCSVTL